MASHCCNFLLDLHLEPILIHGWQLPELSPASVGKGEVWRQLESRGHPSADQPQSHWASLGWQLHSTYLEKPRAVSGVNAWFQSSVISTSNHALVTCPPHSHHHLFWRTGTASLMVILTPLCSLLSALHRSVQQLVDVLKEQY